MADRWPKIRVLVAGMPRMLTDIVRNIIVSESDLEFAGEADDTTNLAQVTKNKRANVLVIGAAAVQDSAAYQDLLYQRPRLSIVAIDADARGAQLFDLRPHVSHLGDISPATLVAALRRQPQSDLQT